MIKSTTIHPEKITVSTRPDGTVRLMLTAGRGQVEVEVEVELWAKLREDAKWFENSDQRLTRFCGLCDHRKIDHSSFKECQVEVDGHKCGCQMFQYHADVAELHHAENSATNGVVVNPRHGGK